MSAESQRPDRRVPVMRAVRHHLAVVMACLMLGLLAGWAYASSSPAGYTSTALVLVNPSAGNPYAPTSSSVRQDELTSLETEAQIARSTEVLSSVAGERFGLTVDQLVRDVEVTVPPNTQILQISFSSTDRRVARQVTDAVATGYLENRERRYDEVNAARIDRVQTQIEAVVEDLRIATEAAAEAGAGPDRSFQRRLANALRNELVSQRAQLSALENSEFSAGAVISPASSPQSVGALKLILTLVGGALAGLALGCLIAVLLEWTRGKVRSPRDVEAAGLPVVAAVPTAGWRARRLRTRGAEALAATVRRLRATILDLQPRPDVITIAPAGTGESDASTSEAVAESFAKAGHRVVLVRTDGATTEGLLVEDHGLAEALLHERLCVLDLLQPSVEPLLSLLPHGQFDAQSRELLVADRIRATLTPLIAAGHLVVIQSPGIDTADGEAFVSAADLGLVVVTTGRTSPAEVDQATRLGQTHGKTLAALVVGHSRGARRTLRTSVPDKHWESEGSAADPAQEEAGTNAPVPRSHR